MLPSIRKTGEYKIKGIGSSATEDDKRLFLRKQLKEHNKHLTSEAKKAGVGNTDNKKQNSIEYAIFQNEGYKGLYDGLTKRQIAVKKGLKPENDILDHMRSTELAANFFRVTQTEEKLKREKIKTKEKANEVHYLVGRKVRETMLSISGIAPEDLPFVENIKKIEKKGTTISKLKFKDFSQDLWKICAFIIYQEGKSNEITTRTLIEKLPSYIKIEDKYKEIAKVRQEPKYMIMVRNIKSNKNNKPNPIRQGYLEDIKEGFRLTQKGIDYLKSGFKD